MFSAITGLAVASGPLVGGAVVAGIGWEWIFWINVPIGLLAIPLVLTRLRESRGPDAGLDIPGLALATAGAFGIVWGLVRGNQAGWGSAEVLASLAPASRCSSASSRWERRAREPMLPLQSVPLARVLGRQRGDLLHVRLAVRRRLLLRRSCCRSALGYGPLARPGCG